MLLVDVEMDVKSNPPQEVKPTMTSERHEECPCVTVIFEGDNAVEDG